MPSNNIQFPHTPTRSDSTHPYAIVTTSTALLTRSNSINNKLPHHSYSPSSVRQFSSPTSLRHDYRGHRHTRSLTSLPSPPPALPAPPSSEEDAKRWPRNGVITDYETSSESGSEFDLQPTSPSFENPKVWDVTKLYEYLMSQNLSEIAEFVRAENLSGRSFLRFSPSSISPGSIESLKEDQVGTLLDQARKLRIIALKSRIRSLQGSDREDDDQTGTNPIQRVKVKGMVQAYEKGGQLRNLRIRTDSTASSDSNFSSNSRLGRAGLRRRDTFDQEDFASASEPESEVGFVQEYTRGSLSTSTESSLQLRTPSPPADIVQPLIRSTSDESNAEPSIEELLSQNVEAGDSFGSLGKSWGAKAWEEDNLGATARRIPLASPAEANQLDEFGNLNIINFPSVVVQDMHGERNDASDSSIQEHILNMSPSADEKDDPENHDEFVKEFESAVQAGPKISFANSLFSPDAAQSDTASQITNTVESETVEELRARVAALEARIQGLELSQVTEEERSPSDDINSPADMDLPQYLLMAGVGVCAVIGQAVFRKFMRA